MKIILTETIKSLGQKGEMVNVSDGYARNYLFPRKLAIPADAQAINELKNREASLQHKKDEELASAKAVAGQLEGKSIKIAAKAGQNGRLFGSVTGKEISEALKKQMGVEVDKRKLSLSEDIKSFGTYQVEAKLMPGISTKLYIVVGEES